MEKRHTGALESQWIPVNDRELWGIERYPDFLEARRELLADAMNSHLDRLRDGGLPHAAVLSTAGRVGVDEEESALDRLNDWLLQQSLVPGQPGSRLEDDSQDEAGLDLAWPDGVQEELSDAVALVLEPTQGVLSRANKAGYRCYTSIEEFRRYVTESILGQDEDAA